MVLQVCQANVSGLRTVSDTENFILGRPRNIPSLHVRSYSASRRRLGVRPPTQAKAKLIIHCLIKEHVKFWHYFHPRHRAFKLVDETSRQDDSEKHWRYRHKNPTALTHRCAQRTVSQPDRLRRRTCLMGPLTRSNGYLHTRPQSLQNLLKSLRWKNRCWSAALVTTRDTFYNETGLV